MTDTSQQTQASGAAHWTDADFQANLKKAQDAGKAVFVDFYADWCGPCQIAAPIVDKLAGEYAETAEVVKVNVDENTQTAGQFGVMSIPTAIVFGPTENGMEEIDKLIGFRGEPGYRQMLDKAVGAKQ